MFQALGITIGAAQAGILGGLFYLSRLATTRAGVNHHVYYMKAVYVAENGIASPANVLCAVVLVTATTAVAGTYLVLKEKRRSHGLSPLLVFSTIIFVLAAGSFAWAALSASGQALLIYPYALAGLLIFWALGGASGRRSLARPSGQAE